MVPKTVFLLSLACFFSRGLAGYTLVKDYTFQNFFESFDFYTEADPTQGTVQYVDFEAANSSGLVGTVSGANFTNLVYLGVDNKNVVADGDGRQSVRVSSTDVFNHGLFVFDVVHSPGGLCGAWPALWLIGNPPAGQNGTWPDYGEIDIMEGVNSYEANQMTLHTTYGCDVASASGYAGSLVTPDCNVYNASQPGNAGCGVRSTDPQTFGALFNENYGGVYATEWTSSYIKIWFFPRDNIPSDILAGGPVPSQAWGLPQANFEGSCNFDDHFQNMQIIVDTTFCGDWAGNDWNTSSCKANALTCSSWVEGHPEAFKDAFWAFNSIKVYELS